MLLTTDLEAQALLSERPYGARVQNRLTLKPKRRVTEMEDSIHEPVRRLFHQCMLVERSEIFGQPDPIPINAFKRNATVMWPGVVGPAYRQGGLMMMGVNPGGGKDTYNQARHGENELYPLLHQLEGCRQEDVGPLFEKYSHVSLRVQREWNIWRLIHEVLNATDIPAEGYAYLNAVPYRTRGDSKPRAAAIKRSWEKIVTPQLAILKPGVIAALGKKAAKILTDHYKGPAKIFVIPRTNGDRYISKEAEEVLLQMSMHFRRLAS